MVSNIEKCLKNITSEWNCLIIFIILSLTFIQYTLNEIIQNAQVDVLDENLGKVHIYSILTHRYTCQVYSLCHGIWKTDTIF